METTVVNLNKEPYDVYIGRGTKIRTHMLTKGIKPGEEGWLGNPHPIGWCDICREYHTRKECIERFKKEGLNLEKSGELSVDYLSSLGYKIKKTKEEMFKSFGGTKEQFREAIEKGIIDKREK